MDWSQRNANNWWVDTVNFARDAHGRQVRKYTGEPYIRHPIAVAEKIYELPTTTPEMVMAALLHDVREDTTVKADEILRRFGETVANYVDLLTDPPHSFGNRAKRKAFVAFRMLHAPWQVKTIKLADLIDNAESILKYDRNFARVFFDEKSVLLDNLIGGNQELWNEAMRICQAAQSELGMDAETPMISIWTDDPG